MRTVVTGGQLTMLSFTFTWFFRPCNKLGNKLVPDVHCKAKFRGRLKRRTLYFPVENEAVKQRNFIGSFLMSVSVCVRYFSLRSPDSLP